MASIMVVILTSLASIIVIYLNHRSLPSDKRTYLRLKPVGLLLLIFSSASMIGGIWKCVQDRQEARALRAREADRDFKLTEIRDEVHRIRDATSDPTTEKQIQGILEQLSSLRSPTNSGAGDPIDSTAEYAQSKKIKEIEKPKIFHAEVASYVTSGFVEPGFASDEIRISGENFGQRPGQIYELLGPEKTMANSPLLKIIAWSNTKIRAEFVSPLSTNSEGSLQKFIGLTTADSRVSEPIELLPGNGAS